MSRRKFLLILILITGSVMVKPVILKSENHELHSENNYIKARIYYYGWDVMTRTRVSLPEVRRGYRIKTDIIDHYEIEMLIRFLNIDQLKPVDNPETAKYANDPRLVIDFFDRNNVRSTYYASRFNLLSEDSSLSRSIDQVFRNRFTFGSNQPLPL